MMTFDHRFVQPLLLALSVTAFLAGPVTAEAKDKPPKVTEWMFMEMTGINQYGVDWEAEDSIEIKIDKSIRDTIEFGTPEGVYGIGGDYDEEDFTIYDEAGNPHYIGGTRWLRMPVVHTTVAGDQVIGHIYWLLQDVDGDGELDEPKQGTKTPTGPDGNVTHFATALAVKAPTDDLYNPGKWYVVSSGGQRKLCIAVGLFKM